MTAERFTISMSELTLTQNDIKLQFVSKQTQEVGMKTTSMLKILQRNDLSLAMDYRSSKKYDSFEGWDSLRQERGAALYEILRAMEPKDGSRPDAYVAKQMASRFYSDPSRDFKALAEAFKAENDLRLHTVYQAEKSSVIEDLRPSPVSTVAISALEFLRELTREKKVA